MDSPLVNEHSVAQKFGSKPVEPADRPGHGAVIRAYAAEVFGIEARGEFNPSAGEDRAHRAGPSRFRHSDSSC